MRDMIQVRVNGTLPGYRAGQVVNVECDQSGVPFSQFWRRRLKDAEIDNCCEVVVPEEGKAPGDESEEPTAAHDRSDES